MKKLIVASCAMLLATPVVQAEEHNHQHHNHSDVYAPFNVKGAHSHDKDEWMLSYNYVRMEMKDMKQGSKTIDLADVYSAGYTVAPVKMTTDMHMFSAMKGLTDDFTLMAMTSYIEKDMSLRTSAGVTFNTSAEGLGDTKISLIDDLGRYGESYTPWSTMLTLSLPTGSTDQQNNTPMGTNTRLPYPMQLGSGTFDITPALTYQCRCYGVDVGGQAFATFRMGDGEESYRLGNQFGFKAWAGKAWTEALSTGLNFAWLSQSGISGSDRKLNPNMLVTADSENSGFDKATLGFDIAYKPAALNGLEFVTAYDEPIYQEVDGIQMKSQRTLTVGLRQTF